MLGLDDKRGAAKFEAARVLHAQILKNTDTISANAVKAFYIVFACYAPVYFTRWFYNTPSDVICQYAI